MSEEKNEALRFKIDELDDGVTITITGDKALAKLIANAAQQILTEEAKDGCDCDVHGHAHASPWAQMHHAHSQRCCHTPQHAWHSHRQVVHGCCRG